MTAAYVPQQEILAELAELTSRIIHVIVRPVKKLSKTIALMTDGVRQR